MDRRLAELRRAALAGDRDALAAYGESLVRVGWDARPRILAYTYEVEALRSMDPEYDDGWDGESAEAGDDPGHLWLSVWHDPVRGRYVPQGVAGSELEAYKLAAMSAMKVIATPAPAPAGSPLGRAQAGLLRALASDDVDVLRHELEGIWGFAGDAQWHVFSFTLDCPMTDAEAKSARQEHGTRQEAAQRLQRQGLDPRRHLRGLDFDLAALDAAGFATNEFQPKAVLYTDGDGELAVHAVSCSWEYARHLAFGLVADSAQVELEGYDDYLEGALFGAVFAHRPNLDYVGLDHWLERNAGFQYRVAVELAPWRL